MSPISKAELSTLSADKQPAEGCKMGWVLMSERDLNRLEVLAQID